MDGVLEKLIAPTRLVKALLKHLTSAAGKGDRARLLQVLIPKNKLQQEIAATLSRLEMTRQQTKEIYKNSPPVTAQPKNDPYLQDEHRNALLYHAAQDPFLWREESARLFTTSIPRGRRSSQAPRETRKPSRRKR